MSSPRSVPAEAADACVPTVLVVEDDILVRTVVSDYLRDCRFTVVEAGSADEAIRLLGAGLAVDLVFSDVNMPGELDGFGLSSWVRAHYPAIKIILTSGAARPLAVAKEHGPIVAKPYSYEDLVRRITEILSR